MRDARHPISPSSTSWKPSETNWKASPEMAKLDAQKPPDNRPKPSNISQAKCKGAVLEGPGHPQNPIWRGTRSGADSLN